MKSLEKIVKIELFSNYKKLKQKYPPISEKVKGNPEILTIKKVYSLSKQNKKFYLIITSDPSKKSKKRIYICKILASQSSDLLVKIATKIILKLANKLKLIQYSLDPVNLRVNLLCMAELSSPSETKKILKLLENVQKKMKEKLDWLVNLEQ